MVKITFRHTNFFNIQLSGVINLLYMLIIDIRKQFKFFFKQGFYRKNDGLYKINSG